MTKNSLSIVEIALTHVGLGLLVFIALLTKINFNFRFGVW